MFLNLSSGQDLYILDVRDRYKLLVGQVVKVTPSIARQARYNPMVMYPTNSAVDISVKVEGEDKEFTQIPSSLTVADFSNNGFVLMDSKDALVNYLTNALQESESILASYDRHKLRAEDCKNILVTVNPKLAAEAKRDDTISQLQNQVNTLSGQLKQLIDALKPETKEE